MMARGIMGVGVRRVMVVMRFFWVLLVVRLRSVDLARQGNADGEEIDRTGGFQITMCLGGRACARDMRLVLMVVVIVMLIMMMGIVMRMLMMLMVVMIMIRMIMMRVVMFGLGMAVKPAVLGMQMFRARFGPFMAFGGVVRVLAGERLSRLGGIKVRVVDDGALNPLAIATAARTAMPGTPAGGPVLVLLLGLAVGPFVGLDQCLTIGDRDLIIIGMDFAEGQEAVAVAAIFDEGRLQRRLDARDLGEIDVAAQLLALGGLEIKFLDAIAADHDNSGLFRMGGVDQHFVWHF